MAEVALFYGRGKMCGQEVTEESFIREAYLELYAAEDTGEDIDAVQFSPVVAEDTHFLVGKYTYDATVSADVGYNVQEQYVDKETVYIDGERHVKDVIKTRNVTKWQPYNANLNDWSYLNLECLDYSVKQDIGDKDEQDEFYGDPAVDLAMKTAAFESVDVDDAEMAAFPQITEQKLIDRAHIAGNTGSAFSEYRYSIPGDTHRNFHTNWTLKRVDAIAYVIERMKMSFEYRGQKCIAYKYATQKGVAVDYPKNEDSEVHSFKEQEKQELANDPTLVKLRQKNEKGFMTMLIGVGGSLLLSFILSDLGGLFMVAMVGFLAYGLIASGKIKRALEKREAEIKQEYAALMADRMASVQNRKVELLKARFEKLGFAPLSEDEIARFAPLCED